MKQLYKCEICGEVFDVKSLADECEIKHLIYFVDKLNERAELAKQHNLVFMQTCNPGSDKYIWTLEEIK